MNKEKIKNIYSKKNIIISLIIVGLIFIVSCLVYKNKKIDKEILSNDSNIEIVDNNLI